MKKKNLLIVYIIALLILAIPVTIYGVMHFSTYTSSSTNKNDNKTPSDDSSNSDENTNKPVEEPTKVVDRFEGKTLINPKGIPVLCYHAIGDDKTNTLYVSQEKFKEQMDYLKNNGYFTLTMKEFNDYILNNKSVPEKAVLITFDDGYSNNYTLAYPILKNNLQNATIALITDFSNDSFYLSKDQILEMHKNGIEFVSHTTKHQSLDEFSYEEQLKILKDSKLALENILGEPQTVFIYPYSKYNQYSEKAVKEAGYNMAFDLDGGIASRNDSPIHIKRQYVNGNYNLEQFKTLLIVK
jgi:peptidoglycan/xylan/chitin deacetylase (PgdA/CDA1 family)